MAKTYHEGIIEVSKCETAGEFLDFLQIRHERWLPHSATFSPWIFRGQRRADWQLVPKAMRPEFVEYKERFQKEYRAKYKKEVEESVKELSANLKSFVPGHSNERFCEIVLQVHVEKLTVQEFVDLADQVGHSIPEDKNTQAEEITLNNTIFEIAEKGRHFTDYSFHPHGIEFALAQHHGIPTRLLDWTSQPLVAAFFASEDAYKCTKSPDYTMAVWAINRAALAYGEENHSRSLRDITHRRAKISYLHAQGGLSIYDQSANKHFIKNGNWRSLNEALENDKPTNDEDVLRKVTLPVQLAGEALRLLSVENFTRAHLMPTYDNITETLRLRRLIENDLSQTN